MKRLEVYSHASRKWEKANKFQTNIWTAVKLKGYGLTVEQIADVLLVSPKTVEMYTSRNLSNYRTSEYKIVKVAK